MYIVTHIHTHTHAYIHIHTLAQNSISNCWSGMYPACKSKQVTWLKGQDCSTEFWMLDCAAQNQIAKTVQELKLAKIDMPVLGLAGCRIRKRTAEMDLKKQVCRADQALYPIQSGSFVGRGPWLYATSPCDKLKLNEQINGWTEKTSAKIEETELKRLKVWQQNR